MKKYFFYFLCLFLILFSTTIFAKPKSSVPKTAYINLENSDIDAVTLEKINNYIRATLEKYPNIQLLPKTDLKQEEMLSAVNCKKKNTKCFAKIGKNMEVMLLLYGKISAKKKGYKLEISSVLVPKRRLTKRAKVSIRGEGDVLHKSILGIIKKILGPAKFITLLVDTEPVKAKVFLDNEERGVTPLTLNKRISMGEHKLKVMTPGYESVEKDINLTAGNKYEFKFDLKQLEGQPGQVAVVDTAGGTKVDKVEVKEKADSKKGLLGVLAEGGKSVAASLDEGKAKDSGVEAKVEPKDVEKVPDIAETKVEPKDVEKVPDISASKKDSTIKKEPPTEEIVKKEETKKQESFEPQAAQIEVVPTLDAPPIEEIKVSKKTEPKIDEAIKPEPHPKKVEKKTFMSRVSENMDGMWKKTKPYTKEWWFWAAAGGVVAGTTTLIMMSGDEGSSSGTGYKPGTGKVILKY